eukprot:m.36598 g.36598  ORF g.36598 m.36598 type:complete len:217 (+) comp14513_c0_seq1:133-783(+)
MADAGNAAAASVKDSAPAAGELPGDDENTIKIICLGDSMVGKSKLVERFLMDDYEPHQLSTYALTLFRHAAHIDGKDVVVDFWDTAGQERFNSMHPSYYHQAHACLLVFDITRKTTYKHLSIWYKELREYREKIPCIVVANKIDVDLSVTQKSFGFGKKHGMPFYFVSAADGTNVVKVFTEIIKMGQHYKENSDDFVDQVMQLLSEGGFDDNKAEK